MQCLRCCSQKDVYPSEDTAALTPADMDGILRGFRYPHSSNKIGEGDYGDVFRSRYRGRSYAVKILKGDSETKKYFYERIEAIGPLLKHPNLVSLRGCIVRGYHYIVMDYIDGIQLTSEVIARHFSIRRYADLTSVPSFSFCSSRYREFRRRRNNCAKIVQQVSSTLAYLHQNHYIYRDLKKENLIVVMRRRKLEKVTLIDLDSIRHIDTDDGYPPKNEGEVIRKRRFSLIGVPLSSSPQFVNENEEYTTKADCWSLGILIYYLFTRSHPFASIISSSEIYLKNIYDSQLTIPDYVPDAAKDLIEKLLQKKEEDRPSLQEIENHPFFTI